MNHYALLGSRLGSREAASLSDRLAAWHDSMVAHERRLRAARTDAACDDECPHAEYTGIAIEYGTRPVYDVLQALRADNWLHLDRSTGRPDVADELVRRTGRQMLDAFYIDTEEWQGNVLSEARKAISQAITGLTAGHTVQLTEDLRSTSSNRSPPRWQRDSSSQ